MYQNSRRLKFKPVDFIPFTGIVTFENRNHVKIENYPSYMTAHQRLPFAAYQMLSSGAVALGAFGIYRLAENLI